MQGTRVGRGRPGRVRESAAAASAAPEELATPGSAVPESAAPEAEAAIRELTTRFRGVGRKTAEALVAAFGPADAARVLTEEPDRVRAALGGGQRIERLLRSISAEAVATAEPAPAPPAPGRIGVRRGGRRGGRTRQNRAVAGGG